MWAPPGQFALTAAEFNLCFQLINILHTCKWCTMSSHHPASVVSGCLLGPVSEIVSRFQQQPSANVELIRKGGALVIAFRPIMFWTHHEVVVVAQQSLLRPSLRWFSWLISGIIKGGTLVETELMCIFCLTKETSLSRRTKAVTLSLLWRKNKSLTTEMWPHKPQSRYKQQSIGYYVIPRHV